MFPALAGGFLTTAPPGKPKRMFFLKKNNKKTHEVFRSKGLRYELEEVLSSSIVAKQA